jgi:dihydroneopterin aldolase
MSKLASIELRNLKLETQIGTYKPGDVIPNEHLLDLTLWIDPSLVFITEDDMKHVFDYDPLIVEIDNLSRDGHYETQERLISRIIEACAQYHQIQSLEIGLRKSPVRNETGSLGVRISMDQVTLVGLRKL